MAKLFLRILALILCASSPLAYAQKRVEVGVLLDYLSISQTNTDNVGLGARVGYRLHRHVMMEGEFAYDYGVNFQEAYRDL